MNESNGENSVKSRQKNLVPWEKGQSGNPKGLKKGTKHSLHARMNRLLKKRSILEVIEILKDELLLLNLTSRVLVLKALEGDTRSLNQIIKKML